MRHDRALQVLELPDTLGGRPPANVPLVRALPREGRDDLIARRARRRPGAGGRLSGGLRSVGHRAAVQG